MELVILVCLAGEPDTCREERLPSAACLATAPAFLAEWLGENPELNLKNWRCEGPRTARIGAKR